MEPQFGNSIPTGDSIDTAFKYYRFRVPANDWLIKAIIGQFLMQVYPSGWFQGGAVTPGDAAEAATLVYESVTEIPNPIGSIVVYASTLPADPNLLPCNGQTLFRADWPELFAAIGTVWGAPDIATFKVPDLRGRVMMDNGQGPGLLNRVPGQYLGEEVHTLIDSEMPEHTHLNNEHVHTSNHLAQVSVFLQGELEPDVDATIYAGTTDPATVDILPSGGGGDHNNIQPSAVLVFGIIAR